MKTAAFVCAILGLLAGLVAAYFWALASKDPPRPISLDPDWKNSPKFLPPDDWLLGLVFGNLTSGVLNTKAASWTALAVVLNAISAILGTWPF